MARFAMPIDVSRINSWRPCESCGVKKVRFKATFAPPGTNGVTHRLCDRCIEGIRQHE